MAIYSLICSLLVLFCISSLLFKSFINPCSIYSLVWLSISIGAAFFETTIEDKYKLSFTTISIIFLSVLFFFIGSILNLNKYIHNDNRKLNYYEKSYKFSFFLLLISFFLLPIVISKAYSIVSNSTFNSVFIALRSELTDENGQTYGIGAYGTIIANLGFLFTFNDYLKTGSNKKLLIVCFVISLIFDVLNTGRTFLLFTLIPALFILFLNRGVKLFYLLCSLALLFPIFIVFNILKTFSNFDTTTDIFDIKEIVDSIQIYFLGGIYALNNKLASMNFIGKGDGFLVFRTIKAILNSIGFDTKVQLLIQEYENSPIKTNVYSIFYPYLYDFGIWSVLIFSFFIGLVHTFFFKNSKENESYLILNCLLFYPLLMSFFQDQYFTLMSTWIQYTFLILIRNLFLRFNFK